MGEIVGWGNTYKYILFVLAFRPEGLLAQSDFQGNTSSALKIWIQVADLKSKEDSWSKLICESAFKSIKSASKSGAHILCERLRSGQFVSDRRQELKDYNLSLRITRSFDNKVQVVTTNLSPQDETDITSIGWSYDLNKNESSLKSQSPNFHRSFDETLRFTLSNLITYTENIYYLKASLLVAGLETQKSNSITLSQNRIYSHLTGEKLSWSQAYAEYKDEQISHKNYLRTSLEILALLGAAQVIYYKNLVYNSVDFDYGLWDGLKHKFITFKAVKYDDNDKFANAGHALAGYLYASAARSNGFTGLQSLAISIISSLAWEVLEYHEVLSINDMIVTPFGGYIISEASREFACALLQKGDGWSHQTLSALIYPMGRLNHLLNKLNGEDNLKYDEECKKKRWAELRFYVGGSTTEKGNSNNGSQGSVGIDGRIIKMNNIGEAGEESGWAFDTAAASLRASIDSGKISTLDLNLVTQILSFAHYNRKVVEFESGEKFGHEFIFGLGHDVFWRDRGTNSTDDFYGTVGLVGPAAIINIYRGGYRLSIDASVSGDFAMIRSMALAEISPKSLDDANASVVEKRNYHFGWGATLSAGVRAIWDRFEIGANFRQSFAKSTNWRERNYETRTVTGDLKDGIRVFDVYASFQLSEKWHLKLVHEHIYREGTYKGPSESMEKKNFERRTMVLMEYRF